MTKTILYADHTAKMGGGEIALLNLVTGLDTTRFTPVVVLGSEDKLADKLREQGVETHILPLDPTVLETRKDSLGLSSLIRVRRITHCVGYAFRLARFARQRRVDLIHTNSLKSDLYGGFAGRIAGIPVIWHVRDHIDRQYLPWVVASAFRCLARLIPSAVITNSESTLRRLAPSGPQKTGGVSSGVADRAFIHATRVIHDGFNLQQFSGSPTPQTTQLKERPVITLIGRIAPWKGQNIFIEAAARVRARFPGACFRIVGTPLFGEHDYEQSLRDQVRALGLEGQVEFLGFRDDIPAVLAETDVVVHASTLGEPFGQVVIEGMAMGKPVIATDGGALPEIVESGKTGLLVPMGDAPAMAGAIERLLSDPVWAQALGLAGQQRVRERFTIQHTVAKVQALYEQMLDISESPGANSEWPLPAVAVGQSKRAEVA